MDIIPYAPGLAIQLSPIFKAALEVCDKLKGYGFQAAMVGGCVRDFILHPAQCPVDIDISTNAAAEQILKVFKKSHAIGSKFGVVLVTQGSFEFEVSMFRQESNYTDRRHPDHVSEGNVEQDSVRRDFTINALYFFPSENVIFDFHDGYRDLRLRKLKCIGNPQIRLHEDPLRIIRLFRFQASHALEIDSSCFAILPAVSEGIALLSKERIQQEITKINPSCFFVFCKELFAAVEPKTLGLPSAGVFPEFERVFKTFSKIHIQLPLLSLAVLLCPPANDDRWDLKNFINSVKKWPGTACDQSYVRFFEKLLRHTEDSSQSEESFLSHFTSVFSNDKKSKIEVIAFLLSALNARRRADYLSKLIFKLREFEMRDIHLISYFFQHIEENFPVILRSGPVSAKVTGLGVSLSKISKVMLLHRSYALSYYLNERVDIPEHINTELWLEKLINET